MHTSLDGFIAGPKGEIDWLKVDEDIFDYTSRLTDQSVFQSIADRDGMAQSGMERGVHETYDRLDELLAKEIAR